MRSPALIALTLLAAPAAAPGAVIDADRAVARACSQRLAAPGAPGVARSAYTSRTAGIVTARLRAHGDWDLAIFDRRSRRGIDASSTLGGRETVSVAAARGRHLLVQACRRPGASRRARLSFSEARAPVRAGRAERIQLVRVALPGPRALVRLERLGLDVTHSATPRWADVVTYTSVERRRLARAGLRYRVRVLDMAAADRRSLAARTTAAAPLPSGRTAYRTYAEYGEDLKALATAHPGLVRPLEIGRSLEDRPIEGIEIATDVARVDDGRPAFVVMGLHHAREWPSGEMPMEFATDLLQRYASDARVRALLDSVRVLILPVINPDGFAVSRGAGPDAGDDSPIGGIGDTAAYRRKNCRAPDPATQAIPCAARPASMGVDLNRNYGAYYGGDGSSSEPSAQDYRGAGPYSEPESQAVHRLSQTRNIVMVVTHHTFTDSGVWLRQPGFCFEDPCDGGDVVPDEPAMRELGDAMAQATGWTSQLGWAIGEITGATEDWNYFATGAYGYTPEQRGANFHPGFATAVAGEWPGVGEALLRALEVARDRAHHSLLTGTAPAGRVLRLSKTFATPTSLAGLAVDDTLDLGLTVPASGRYAWDVNPSTRPLALVPESYVLTCSSAAGAVLETRQVAVARGQSLTADLACGGPAGGGGGGAAGPGGSSGGAVAPASPVRVRLARAVLGLRGFARRPRVTLRVSGGSVSGARLALVDARGRTVASRSGLSLRGSRARATLRVRRALRRGRHRLRVSGRDAQGRAVRASLALRLR